MILQQYRVWDAIVFSLKNAQKLWLVYLFSLVLTMMVESAPVPSVLSDVMTICNALLQMFLGISLVWMALKVVSGQPLVFRDVGFFVSKKGAKLFLSSLINGFFCFFSFALFVLPGFYYLCLYMLTPYIIAHEDLSVFSAMRKSKQLSKGVRWKLFGLITFIFTGYVVVFLGIILLQLSPDRISRFYMLAVLLAWTAFANVMLAWTYRTLQAQANY